MIAVAVSSGARFEHGTETALFATRSPDVLTPFVGSYAVNADGTRFLLRAGSPGAPPPTVTVVVNSQARTGQ
jgi:hypothetical protein